MSVGQPQPRSHKEKTADGNKIKSQFPLSKNPLSKQEKYNEPPHNTMRVSSPQNPPVCAATWQPQLSQNEEENAYRSRLKTQSIPNKNPLARPEKQNKPVEAKKAPDSLGQSMKPKGILQKLKPISLPTVHDDRSTSLTPTDDGATPLRPNGGSSTSLKLKTALPLYDLEQDESESLR
jgi:hypothetical protein